MKALAGLRPPGVSTEDCLWANQELLLLFQKLCKPEVCTGGAALAGARNHNVTRGRALGPSRV
jgi:hypothetical protein